MTKDEKNLEQVLAKIAGLDQPERSAVQRMHEVILEAAPHLKPRIWYGMPGYARTASTPVLVFVRKDDVMVLGVSEKAARVPGGEGDGRLRPSAWYFDAVDAATERRVAEIVRAATA
ncbi:DUF1801 domain-containing protein [Nocardioides zeae]|uniref:DUF1801 domain-containing protein n=1 Tax=Nocardioides imazamoxiresistens TaxID=3231893 RepID=A0ABU3PSD1_9ACTN|nr:DUF1801 domain-containing protein [Nocardioides zeae]MDT9592117.1 DUF1801 domain-containing protein [Nocardioides zeae]